MCEDGKTRKRDRPNKNQCIVGTTIVVPYNSFAVAVPLGLWRIWCIPYAINMSPRWGYVRRRENQKTG